MVIIEKVNPDAKNEDGITRTTDPTIVFTRAKIVLTVDDC